MRNPLSLICGKDLLHFDMRAARNGGGVSGVVGNLLFRWVEYVFVYLCLSVWVQRNLLRLNDMKYFVLHNPYICSLWQYI